MRTPHTVSSEFEAIALFCGPHRTLLEAAVDHDLPLIHLTSSRLAAEIKGELYRQGFDVRDVDHAALTYQVGYTLMHE
jgi:hypothetical protein